MKKIGVCTLYYNNRNYGGNLQAYALNFILSTMGYDVEHINYYYSTKFRRMLSAIKQIVKKKDKIARDISKRNKAVDYFNKSIPHSKMYYINTIDKANISYDCFITGSDQVWNPDFINRFMSLQFTDGTKPTVAYAASTGKIALNEDQKNMLKIALEHTKYVSIREKDSIPALKEISEKPISYVLDPTMLLTAKEWDNICSERLIKEDYLFCYFLGGNENLRKVAREYSDARGIKLVTLPYLNATYRKVDEEFGDYPLYEVSPKDFLSLIKFASFVMTDSFHATVFSHLYERPFVVSGKKEDQMGCRMKSLVELFGTEERYFSDHNMVSVGRLQELEGKTMVINWSLYEIMKKRSIEFLKRAVSDER